MSAAKKFHARAFVTLLLTFSFVLVVVSGLVLFVEPRGRIAYWTDWRLLGLGKQHWDSIHISSTTLFLVTSIFHIYYNWKLLVCYLQGKVQKSRAWSRELIVSLAVVLLFLVGSIAWFQPFGAFFELNERIKSSWSTAADEQPPFGHAELASIAALCRSQRLELQPALARLAGAGYKAASAEQTVKQLAGQYQVTPREIFAVLRGAGRQSALPVSGRRQGAFADQQRGPAPPSAGRLFQRFAGRGLGRLTVAELCAELGLEPERGLAALQRHGISARADQTLKSVAQASRLRPAEVLDRLCQGGGCR